MFPEELLDAYPDAKVILSLREEDGWYKSMMSTLWADWQAAEERESAGRRLGGAIHKALWDDDFPANGRACFQRHNENVKKLRVDKTLLEYHIGDGWEPLCSFLGVPVPDIEYTRSDDWAKHGWRRS